jgi:hypothetical protein
VGRGIETVWVVRYVGVGLSGEVGDELLVVFIVCGRFFLSRQVHVLVLVLGGWWMCQRWLKRNLGLRRLECLGQGSRGLADGGGGGEVVVIGGLSVVAEDQGDRVGDAVGILAHRRRIDIGVVGDIGRVMPRGCDKGGNFR